MFLQDLILIINPKLVSDVFVGPSLWPKLKPLLKPSRTLAREGKMKQLLRMGEIGIDVTFLRKKPDCNEIRQQFIETVEDGTLFWLLRNIA